jgi:hypothetical protein
VSPVLSTQPASRVSPATLARVPIREFVLKV